MSSILLKLVPLNLLARQLKLFLPLLGALSIPFPYKNVSSSPAPESCCTSPMLYLVVFIKSGAWFSIDTTLYLAGSLTKLLDSTPFFNTKNVSSSILFLSEDGNANQTEPSPASYQRSIAIL